MSTTLVAQRRNWLVGSSQTHFPKGNWGVRHRTAQDRDPYVSWFAQIHHRL